MDVFTCIKTRRSIRKYLDAPVEWDKVVRLLEAGKEAPTSGNLQNFKLIVVTNPDKRKALAHASVEQYWMESAPIHIVICALPKKASMFYGIRGEKLYSIQNCAAIAQNMLLAGHAMGLGGCWVGAFEEELVRNICGIDVNGRPQIILTFGYPDEKPPRPARYKLENITFINSWWCRHIDTAFTQGRSGDRNVAKAKKTMNWLENMSDKVKKKGKELSKKIKSQP